MFLSRWFLIDFENQFERPQLRTSNYVNLWLWEPVSYAFIFSPLSLSSPQPPWLPISYFLLLSYPYPWSSSFPPPFLPLLSASIFSFPTFLDPHPRLPFSFPSDSLETFPQAQLLFPSLVYHPSSLLSVFLIVHSDKGENSLLHTRAPRPPSSHSFLHYPSPL